MAIIHNVDGFSNRTEGTGFGATLPNLDPTKYVRYFDDFFQYVAGDWTVTETQAGATEALTDAFGGRLLLTNTNTEDDLTSIQRVGESFKFASGRKSWLSARFQISDATEMDFLVGLAITDTSPIVGVSDGAYFYKEDGSTTVQLISRSSSVTLQTVSLGTITAATDITLGMFYDGDGTIRCWVNDTEVTGVTGGSLATLFSTTELRPTIALQAGAAAAHTLSIDYFLAQMTR